MPITQTNTLIREDVCGSEKVRTYLCQWSGTSSTQTQQPFDADDFGLDVIDFIEIMIDGSGPNTNGIPLLTPAVGGGSMVLYASGGNVSGTTFAIISTPVLLTGLQFMVRVWGVA